MMPMLADELADVHGELMKEGRREVVAFIIVVVVVVMGAVRIMRILMVLIIVCSAGRDR